MCRVSLIDIYTPIAVWHIVGVLPGGRGTTPYCMLSNNSLIPSIRNRHATITPPAINTMSSINILPPIKIVLNLFLVFLDVFHCFPLLLLLYYTLLLLSCLLLLCQVVVKFFLFIASAIISLPPERVPWFQSKGALRIVQ
jgi:hypothetical protein